jgi:23S rRNA (cytosine1962-C5)-methyltransferase
MEVILKKGKDRAVLLGHHWIFSGAIEREEAEDGSIVPVKNHSGKIIGYGYYNSSSQIRVRLLSFGDIPFSNDMLRSLLHRSFQRRTPDMYLQGTNAYRLVFSEGDFIPGLVIDNYAGHYVLQCLTRGIDVMKKTIVDMVCEMQSPLSIYERSDYSGRKLEGLPEFSGQLYGTTPDTVDIIEHDVHYPVDIRGGQKTGFFLDQRENRHLIKELSKDKTILNLFSYTGGFTMAALSGGAASTVSVDISAKASAEAESIYSQNAFTKPSVFITEDVFNYIRSASIDEDIIIIDPPAFAKSKADVNRACRGYKDVNLNVIKKAKPGAYLLTCSCSRFIDPDLFQKVIFSAVQDAGRQGQIIRRTGHPSDHPVNIAVPETEYLKGILLKIV